MRLGGNCQGGIIAQEVAGRLADQGREVETLFLLDPGRFPQSPAPMSLIFGAESELNPYLGGASPEPQFDQAYPAGYSVHFLAGAHGFYFESPVLEALAKVIAERLEALDAARAAPEVA